VTEDAVDVDTVSVVPPTVTVGFVAQLPVAVVQNPEPAIVNDVGVPSDEYVVSIELMTGAAETAVPANPNDAATARRTIREFWRICCSLASQTHLVDAQK
jgi:hypothetical protein